LNAAVTPPQTSGGWRAELRLGLRRSGARTVLAERHRLGPLSVQRPFYPEGETCHVYLLHPPGGVVGGDELDIEVRLDQGAQALVTAPGATKFYRSDGRRALQRQRLHIADGAALEWLPPENIFFPGADVRLDTRVELSGTARLAWTEVQCLGRPAIGEAFDLGSVDSGLRIYRDGAPLLLERQRIDPDGRRRGSLLAGLAVAGTLVMSQARATELDACRALLRSLCQDGGEHRAAATLIEDLLILRYLGPSTEAALRLLRATWRTLRPKTLGRVASPPRIWAT
jgi:urease accessory protein